MRKSYNTSGSFVDLLFNMLMGFFMLLLIAIALIKVETSSKDIELKAEYMITLEWPNGNKDDVDLLVKTPQNQIVFYGNRDIKSASLDRDDLGARNDTIILEDGTKVVIKENWEHITLRKALAGEYIVNVLMFSKRDKLPTPVKVKIEKLNPYRLIYSTTVDLYSRRQEETILRFTIGSNGDVIDRSTIPYSLKNKLKIGPRRR